MELKVSKKLDENGIEIVDNFEITEILDGLDAFDNPMKIKGESGQHTIASIQGNIDSIDAQILASQQSKIKWVEYLFEVNNFLKQ